MIGAHFPRGRDLWITAGYGLMVIGVGNGTLAVAEQWIPTGLASLFVTTIAVLVRGHRCAAAGRRETPRAHHPGLAGGLRGSAAAGGSGRLDRHHRSTRSLPEAPSFWRS